MPVAHGLPQATRVAQLFDPDTVAVIGLHTVFEHHTVMGPEALEVFVHEYGLAFPIGIDRPGLGGGLPQTMQAYGMRGTPTLLLIDRAGRLRLHHFGRIDDMALGAAIAELVTERSDVPG